MQEEETISNAEVFLLLHRHLPWLSPKTEFYAGAKEVGGAEEFF